MVASILVTRCYGLLPSLTTKDIVDKAQKPEETVLSPSDFANVPDKELDLRQFGIHVPDDPTMGDKTEGDIAVPDLKRFMDEGTGIQRSAIRQPYRRWPNNEIPYTLSTQYGSYSRSVIAKAMNEYHKKTCVRFVPRDPERHKDYVYIHPDDGCYSLVGRVGGRQPLSLDSGCIQTGTIVHELMHSVGFFHEQSRFDRDQYIEIVWHNVMNGADDQFEKYGQNVIDQLHEPYDYGSIMHYGPYAFSSNGKRTIVARKVGAQHMGQRIQFSEIDLRKINKLYQCSDPAAPVNGNRVIDSTGNVSPPQVKPSGGIFPPWGGPSSPIVGHRFTQYRPRRPGSVWRRWDRLSMPGWATQ
ncbi:CRE-NAS-4 protein [Aphelenchoides avenae]|nr:CRE-NAS-4 protein [Aphelenchus avenae]